MDITEIFYSVLFNRGDAANALSKPVPITGVV